MYPPILRVHLKKDQRRTYLIMLKQCFCEFVFSEFLFKSKYCGFSFELHQQVNAIQKSTHNICFYEEVDKKYTG